MNTALDGRTHIQRVVSGSAFVAIALSLAACGGGGTGGGPGSKQLDLVIGNSLPLTGISKDLGASGKKASQLALDQIKRAASEAGADHTVRLVQRDQGSDSTSAVDAAKTLVGTDGASCLTGPWSSDAVEQTANDVAIPTKTLEISPVSTSQSVADLSDHDLVDSTALPQSLEGSALSSAIEMDLGGIQGKTVNVAASNDSYGDALTHDFVQSWQGNDGTVGRQVVLAAPPPGGSSSGASSSVYSAQAQQLTANGPDATVIIDQPSGFLRLVPALAGGSWEPSSSWGSDQLVSPGLPAQLGSSAIEGMRALAPGTPTGADASTAFVHDFSSAAPHSVKLAPYAAQEFDATILCYLAAVAAGSTDGQEMADKLVDITAPGGEKFSWQQLPDAVKALEDGKDIDYTGASGPIDMDVHGDPSTGVFDVYRYTAHGLEVAGEIPVSKPNPATP